MFEAAVDRLCRSVRRAGTVEVGQAVIGPAGQGPTEGDELGERGRDAGGEGGLAGGPVGVSVGGDDALVNAPARLDLDVGLDREDSGELVVLAVGEQLCPGA